MRCKRLTYYRYILCTGRQTACLPVGQSMMTWPPYKTMWLYRTADHPPSCMPRTSLWTKRLVWLRVSWWMGAMRSRDTPIVLISVVCDVTDSLAHIGCPILKNVQLYTRPNTNPQIPKDGLSVNHYCWIAFACNVAPDDGLIRNISNNSVVIPRTWIRSRLTLLKVQHRWSRKLA